MILTRQKVVIFNPEDHTYFNTNTNKFMKSVSGVKKLLVEPFDKKPISGYMAMSQAKQLGLTRQSDIDRIQLEILAGWDMISKIANDRGTHIHKIIEECSPYAKESEATIRQQVSKHCKGENFEEAIVCIILFLRRYFECLSEVIVYSEKYNVAGTMDNPGIRQNTKTGLIDIDDWKTNEVTYDSITCKNDIVKHYNKFLLPPFDYLEHSKYIEFVFQLSIYGVLTEETYNRKIGRLTIHNIDHAGNYRMIPIPYMRDAAIKLLEKNKNLKELPVLSSASGSAIKDDDGW